MTHLLIDRAIALIDARRFGEALDLLRQAIAMDPSQWNSWYMAGQCCRFLNDFHGAVQHLSHAVDLNRHEPPIYLALGIAHQLISEWDRAIEALRRAIELDPDYDLAYNSLAFTQKKRGELDKALHNYDAGALALSRRNVKGMRNDRGSVILKYRPTVGQLWLKYASYAALYLTSSIPDISGMAWPTGDQACEEERTETHAGLYWIDRPNTDGELVRMFLPNYFNTFRELLKRDEAYSNLIGNRGTVLELLGQHDEAQQHFDEATEFQP